jgi:hypothetical protein
MSEEMEKEKDKHGLARILSYQKALKINDEQKLYKKTC